MAAKKRILVSAAGTASAWHLCTIINEYFSEKIELHTCDTNEKELVAASAISGVYHRVPPIISEKYFENMLSLLVENKIDYFVPLIDMDLNIFASDSKQLIDNSILSTGPKKHSTEILSNKKNLYIFLTKHGLNTPEVIPLELVKENLEYIIKPKVGFGSNGLRVVQGKQLKYIDENSNIIQERCNGNKPEVTAEIYNAFGKIRIFCRERLETKSGVCTKMRPISIPEIDDYIKKLISIVDIPAATCMQFMFHNDKWNLIDCNLRLGAGTALSTAAGFQLARAFVLYMLGDPADDNLFAVDPAVKSVVRVYNEIAFK